jgi:hypothetical protein
MAPNTHINFAPPLLLTKLHICKHIFSLFYVTLKSRAFYHQIQSSLPKDSQIAWKI